MTTTLISLELDVTVKRKKGLCNLEMKNAVFKEIIATMKLSIVKSWSKGVLSPGLVQQTTNHHGTLGNKYLVIQLISSYNLFIRLNN